MSEHEHAVKAELGIETTQDEVANLAYAIYVTEGRPQGHADQNWVDAEAQLRHAGAGQAGHPEHQDEHKGNQDHHAHMAEDFRKGFWISLVLTLPILALSLLVRESGLALPPQVWVSVHQTLQSRQFDNCFVVGDAAALPREIGKQAFHAIDMGALAAANAARFVDGRALKEFKPAPKPLLIAFGDLQTHLVAGPWVLTNRVLSGAKEGVYQVLRAQMAPGCVVSELPAAAGRLWQSGRMLVRLQLLSLADMRKPPERRTHRLASASRSVVARADSPRTVEIGLDGRSLRADA